MPQESYPPPHIQPPQVDPWVVFDILTEQNPWLLSSTDPDASPEDSASRYAQSPPEDTAQPEDQVQSPLRHSSLSKHVGVQRTERTAGTNPSYFSDRGSLSWQEKDIVEQHCDEPPSTVMERLKDHNPNMTHSIKDIRSAIENERRKKRRREDNGPWTEEELDVLRENTDLLPMALVELLGEKVEGCTKNVDQVRDMQAQVMRRLAGAGGQSSSKED